MTKGGNSRTKFEILFPREKFSKRRFSQNRKIKISTIEFFFPSICAGASLKYSVLYLVGLALPYVHFMFLLWVVFEIFTPIMGRSGTEIPPEVVLASLVTLATIFLSSFFVSIPNVRDHKIWIILGMVRTE